MRSTFPPIVLATGCLAAMLSAGCATAPVPPPVPTPREQQLFEAPTGADVGQAVTLRGRIAVDFEGGPRLIECGSRCGCIDLLDHDVELDVGGDDRDTFYEVYGVFERVTPDGGAMRMGWCHEIALHVDHVRVWRGS